MSFLCIGWGSLIWSPRELPVAGAWGADGPRLPVEFARIARDGRLTLIVREDVEEVTTYWCRLRVDDLDAAIAALAAREGCGPGNVGHWSPDRRGARVVPSAVERVAAWAAARGEPVSGVVWTDLPPMFRTRSGKAWSPEAAIDYLGAIADATSRARAEEYIRRAPPQTRTRVRALAEELLGWMPLGDGDHRSA